MDLCEFPADPVTHADDGLVSAHCLRLPHHHCYYFFFLFEFCTIYVTCTNAEVAFDLHDHLCYEKVCNLWIVII